MGPVTMGPVTMLGLWMLPSMVLTAGPFSPTLPNNGVGGVV